MQVIIKLHNLFAEIVQTESYRQVTLYQDPNHRTELASVSASLYGDTWSTGIIKNTGYAEDDFSYFKSMIEALDIVISLKKLMDAGTFDTWLDNLNS